MSDLAAALRIRAESSHADPDIMRFVLDHDVQAGASVTFDDALSAAAAPLGQALFAVAGVQRVDVSGAVIGVIKVPDADWEALQLPDLDADVLVFVNSVKLLRVRIPGAT